MECREGRKAKELEGMYNDSLRRGFIMGKVP